MEKSLKLGNIKGRRIRGWQRWDGWMTSLTQWTWVWTNSGRQWRPGKPGVLQSMELQRIGLNLATEQQRGASRKGSQGNGRLAPAESHLVWNPVKSWPSVWCNAAENLGRAQASGEESPSFPEKHHLWLGNQPESLQAQNSVANASRWIRDEPG